MLAAPIAFAVPEIGDAGDLPLTAQEPGPAGPLASIEGSISSSSDRDMYKVCLTGGGTFSATTVGGAGFDTQLFLFDSQGLGVYANDDAAGLVQSRLPAGVLLTPQAAGVYYLAVTPFNWDPQSDAGPIFPTGNVVGPTGRGGELPITAWEADDQLAGGGYAIALTGTRSCVDTTPPTVDLRTPPDGAEYARGEEVLADYDCADEPDGSGLASCTGPVADGAAVDTDTLGQHSFAVTAVDGAGNSTTEAHSYRVVDRTAPTIDVRTPPNGAEYALGEQVIADYSCSDEAGGSGVASCAGPVADGAAIDTSYVGAHKFSMIAVDAAGNIARKFLVYTVVDRTPPTIDLRAPKDGARYELGRVVPDDYSCADDAGRAPPTCTGDVPVGAAVDTATLGEHTFTVHSEDAAGNAGTKTATYTVEERFRFEFEGFFWPVANRPKVDAVKAGWIVPIRFSLDGFHGRDVIAEGYPRSREYPCGSPVDLDGGDATRAAGRYRLRYRPHRDLYVYLWKTDRDWAGDCRQFVLKLSDGSYHRADFRFLGKPRHKHDHWRN